MALDILAVVGPTASGKTHKAVALAKALSAEIISGDSRQVYTGMSIGTGKDIDEYGDIPYHLIDICKAGEKYNLHRFLSDFTNAMHDISSRGHLPLLCGGTGMYVESALAGIRTPDVPENKELRKSLEKLDLKQLSDILAGYKTLHNTTDIDTAKRAIRAIEIEEFYKEHPDQARAASRKMANSLQSLVIGIDIPRDIRRERISQRLKARLDDGMIDEVKYLIASGITPEDLIYYGLEYKYVTLHVIGDLSYKDMYTQLETAIHQFAKRQMTWFRGMEKRGIPIRWLPYDMTDTEFADTVCNLYRAGNVS